MCAMSLWSFHTHTHTHTHILTLTHIHPHTHTASHTYTLTHILSHTYTLSHTHTPSHTYTLTHITLSLTHTHLHSFVLSFKAVSGIITIWVTGLGIKQLCQIVIKHNAPGPWAQLLHDDNLNLLIVDRVNDSFNSTGIFYFLLNIHMWHTVHNKKS